VLSTKGRGLAILVSNIRITEDHEYLADVEMHGGAIVTVRLPSVTTIVDDAGLRPLYEGVPAGVLKRAGERGAVVHRCIELDLMGNLDDTSIDPELQGYIDSWRLWRQKREIEVLLLEVPIVYPKKQFAGTPDLFCNLDGKWHLIDFKTRDPVEGDGEQLVGYVHLVCHHLHRWQLLRKCHLAVLSLDKSGDEASLRRYEFGRHCDQWDAALRLWWTRRERRLL